MGHFTDVLIGQPAPKFSLYWLGEPSNYNEDIEALKSFPEGDLGGRYMGLPKEMSPQEFFDSTLPLFLKVHSDSKNRAFATGSQPVESVLCQAIQMTWIFTAEHLAPLQSRIAKLEKQVQDLQGLLDDSPKK